MYHVSITIMETFYFGEVYFLTVKRLAFLTMLVTYLLIVFGGYVASSESGMGCGPDWPLCNGVLIPSLHGATLVEYAHRVIGAILALMTILLWVKLLRANPGTHIRRAVNWMMILLTVQILLGAWVVILDLPSLVITIHLLVAMVFLSILLYLWRTADHPGDDQLAKNSGRQRSLITHVNIILMLLLVTIGFGAYIKHQGYGLACGWLNCYDSWLPITTAQALQTLHRALAVVTAFARNQHPGLRKRIVFAAATVAAQVFIGVITIVTNIDISWAVIHLAFATALFAIVVEIRMFLLVQPSITLFISVSRAVNIKPPLCD